MTPCQLIGPRRLRTTRAACVCGRLLVSASLVFLAGGDGGAVRAEAEVSLPAQAPPHWRSGPYCGVNAAYLFLKLSGRDDISFASIESQIPISVSGSSVLSVTNCLRNHGVDAVAVRATPKELYRVPKPAVALFEPDERVSFEPEGRRHFVVVTSANEAAVQYVDAASAMIQTRTAEEFIRSWSGVLVVQEGADHRFAVACALAAVAVPAVCVVLFASLRRYHARFLRGALLKRLGGD
ncbi:MAG TPA: cysteine peptidase family C39 domain-containing protein [Pirellulales bacterium]|nr:cysteine peptidase family C39 domain-containing protein [Pirellulales bacterium]